MVDTSVVYAVLDGADTGHAQAAKWIRANTEQLVTTPLALAEIDHLLHARGTRAAAAHFREELGRGSIEVLWSPAILEAALAVAEQYSDLPLGLTDASLVALAEAAGAVAVASFDQRHFRAVRPISGGSAFRLLPADE